MSNIIEVVIRATDEASGTVGKLGGAFGGMAKAVLGTVAAIGAAGAATVAFTNKMVDGIEEVNNAALRLGTTAGKLSELHFAADLANVSAESLNNSLQIMQRTAATAAENGGAVARSLADMGINAKNFSALPVDQKLGLVADKFAGMADAGQRARLANELFGRSGAQMLQVLDQGSAGLARAAEEARKFGVVIGPQQAANAKAYGDMLDRVGAAGTGLGRTIAGELIPIITGLGNRFANFIAENREAVGAWVGSVVRNIVAFGIVVGQVFQKVKSYVMAVFDTGGLGKLVQDFVSLVGFAFNKTLELARIVASRLFEYWALSLKAIPKLVYELFKTAFLTVLDLAVTTGKRLWDALKGNVPTTGWFDDLGEVLGRSVNQVVEDVRPMMLGIGDIGKELLTDLKGFGIQTGKEVGDAFSGMFDFDAALEGADALIGKWSEFGEVVPEQLNAAADSSLGFWETMRVASDEWLTSHKTAVEEIARSTFDLMMSTAGAIGDAFAQSLVSGRSLAKGLQDLGKQALTQFVSMLIRIGIQRLILDKIMKSSAVSEGATQLAAGVGQVYVNSFASAAAIPVVGWSIAPGVAQANAALASAQAAASIAAATGAAAAHGGMEYVPREGTYQLQGGERVLSPRQNEDLTSALQGGRGDSGRPLNVNFDENMLTDGRGIRVLLRNLDRELRNMGGAGLMANGRSLQ